MEKNPDRNTARPNSALPKEFHRAIGDHPPATPTMPDERLLELRQRLIDEEHAETRDAFRAFAEAQPEEREQRFAELAHELIDLLYVTYGALALFGLDADELFAEVHRANMDKVGGPRRADGKQLKPPGWRPADVAGVIERQRRRQT